MEDGVPSRGPSSTPPRRRVKAAAARPDADPRPAPLTATLAHLDAALGAGGEAAAARAWRAAEWRILGLFVGHHLRPDDPLEAAAEFQRQTPTKARRLALVARLQAALPRPRTSDRAALDYLTGAAIQWATTTVAQQRLPLAHFPGGDVAAAAQWLAQLGAALETALARARMVRLPQPVVGTLLASRAGQLVAAPAREWRTPRDPSGRTFAAALPDVDHWRLVTAHVAAVAVPLPQDTPATEATAAARARTVLTGGRLKLYLGTWALWAEGSQDDGLFDWDPTHLLLDVYGTKPVTNTAKGRQYVRPHSKQMAALRADFAALRSTWLAGVGEVECDPLQPLIYAYRRTPRGAVLYQHAPLAWQAMKHAFVQVPRAVLHQPATDVPLALGLAGVWRARITTAVLRGPGHYGTTLRALAAELGEDWQAGARHEGRAYWSRLVARLGHVATAGELGTVHVAGIGPTAQVSLEPSDALATVYRPLAVAATAHRARATAIETEVAVRASLAARTPRRKAARPTARR